MYYPHAVLHCITGNPYLTQDLFWVKCWNDSKTITVRVADSCPCKYNISETGEVRVQYWCCGGMNHFDLSYWAFQEVMSHSNRNIVLFRTGYRGSVAVRSMYGCMQCYCYQDEV